MGNEENINVGSTSMPQSNPKEYSYSDGINEGKTPGRPTPKRK